MRDDDGRVLLVRQTYHRGGVRWAAPGGWLARGENPRQAAVRETFEETGLRIVAGRLLEVDGGPYGEVSLVFECRVVGDHGFRPGPETDRIGYFPPDDLPAMTTEMRQLLERTIAIQERWPPGSPPAPPMCTRVPGRSCSMISLRNAHTSCKRRLYRLTSRRTTGAMSMASRVRMA